MWWSHHLIVNRLLSFSTQLVQIVICMIQLENSFMFLVTKKITIFLVQSTNKKPLLIIFGTRIRRSKLGKQFFLTILNMLRYCQIRLFKITDLSSPTVEASVFFYYYYFFIFTSEAGIHPHPRPLLAQIHFKAEAVPRWILNDPLQECLNSQACFGSLTS